MVPYLARPGEAPFLPKKRAGGVLMMIVITLNGDGAR